ncbi:MAG: choice-of-anchor Q domain-containing protein, partial [Chloroflexota bacterium]
FRRNGYGPYRSTVSGAHLTINTYHDDNDRASVIVEGIFDSGFSQATGGAITIGYGTVDIVRSSITRNEATRGGGISVAGNGTRARIFSSVIADNYVDRDGGGIHVLFDGIVELHHTTIANNTADYSGDGFYSQSAFIYAESTLFYRNNSTCYFPDSNNSLTLVGHNAIDGSLSGCNPIGDTDLLITDNTTHLTPLGDYGGTVESYLIYPYSDIIDAITLEECTIATDIRGVSRPQGAGCDIGAVEFVPATLPSDLQTGPTFTVNVEEDNDYTLTTSEYYCSETHCTLREAILASNDNPGLDTIILPAGNYENTAGENVGYNTLNGDDDFGVVGDFDITDDAMIVGAGADVTFVEGLDRTRRIFHVTRSPQLWDVTLSGFTVSNGTVGIFADESNTLIEYVHATENNVGIITDNAGYTGIPYTYSFVINQSAITHNLTGIALYGRDNEIINTTISHNGNENGGIEAYSSAGGATLRNVTLYNNVGGFGGVYSRYLYLYNTVLHGSIREKGDELQE